MRTIILLCILPLFGHAELRIVERSTVYRHPYSDPYDPKNTTGFNHAANVAVMPDGRLVAMWFSGAYEASVNQLVLVSYSANDGRSWTPAEVFSDVPRMSDFDPALLADGKRVWAFFSVGRWIRWPFVSEEKTMVGEQSFQIYQRYSDDSGRTWSPAAAATIDRSWNCRGNGIRHSSGDLLLPVYQLKGLEAAVLKSTDNGETWRKAGSVKGPEGADEPVVAQLRNGDVQMLLRTGGGTFWTAISKDRGESWSAAVKGKLPAARASHSLVRLRDGRLVLTHDADASRRDPLTMRISSDDGKSWGTPLVIARARNVEPPVRSQVSYPSVTELRDGSLLVVWSDLVIGDIEDYGDIQCARVSID
jgi:predicted neuraminidase